jgi:N-acetylmuramoyl-L-alanine amidase
VSDFKIALDAGHYMNTPGKRCLKSIDPNETREWWLNNRICDKVEQLLNSYSGYSILRVDDTAGQKEVTLEARVNAANKWGANFYLSVHHNAGVNGGSGGGIVVYTHPNGSKASGEWSDALYRKLVAKTALKGNRSTPQAKSNLYVLRMTTMPSCLLELGFMDSKTDVPIILTEEYAQHCAESIAEVIVERCKLTKKPTAPSPTLYRVQVGAFSKKENADNLLAELKSKGYQGYIVKV